MTDERRELLRLLEQISDLYPAMRFGQVVEAVAAWS